MIDAVGTSMVQGASLRVTPQATSAYVASAGGAGVSSADVPRYGTRLYVRLDSGAERAILEVRSSETGEVVKQYPSEAQIRAFQRAARLDVSQQQQQAQQVAEQRARDAALREAAIADTGRDAQAASKTADTAAPVQNTAPAQPAPDLYQAAAPRQSAPVTSTPDVASGSPVSSGNTSSGGDAPRQSILV